MENNCELCYYRRLENTFPHHDERGFCYMFFEQMPNCAQYIADVIDYGQRARAALDATEPPKRGEE